MLMAHTRRCNAATGQWQGARPDLILVPRRALPPSGPPGGVSVEAVSFARLGEVRRVDGRTKRRGPAAGAGGRGWGGEF